MSTTANRPDFEVRGFKFHIPEMTKSPVYQTLSTARSDLHKKLFGFKELVRTAQPFPQDAVRTIAYELMESFLRLDDAIDAASPPEVQVLQETITGIVKQSVAEVEANFSRQQNCLRSPATGLHKDSFCE